MLTGLTRLAYGAKQWDVETGIPDLTGKVCVVTGGNTGIGYETCLALAKHKAKVYMASRSESRARDAIAKLKEELSKEGHQTTQVEFLELDLMNLKKSRDAADEFLKRESRLDILILNAGVMATPYSLTEDGIENQIATNHFGHFTFTTRLLPLIVDTSKKHGQARIVSLSSMAHWSNLSMSWRQPDFASLESMNRPFMSTWMRYGQSKVANILFAKELDRRLKDENIFVNAVHPGFVHSELLRGISQFSSIVGAVSHLASSMAALTPPEGAYTSLYTACSPEIQEKQIRGKYFAPFARMQDPSPLAQNEELAKRLWNVSEQVLKEKLGSV
jgi:NAD(P)-dependent dehydrogenase (short-subunit alcohol dehydrogenase family)